MYDSGVKLEELHNRRSLMAWGVYRDRCAGGCWREVATIEELLAYGC